MLRYINNITLRIDYSTIFSALGYKRKSTELPDLFRKEIKGWIDEALHAVKLDAVTARCEISFPDDESVLLSPEGSNPEGSQPETIRIASASLRRFLSSSSKALIMGITAGSAVTELIDKYQIENMTKAVVLDAAAGEIVDAGFDYIVSLLNRELARESGRLLSKRFSPGYGDLTLNAQGDFFRLLDMEKLGVTLTDSFILKPRKSVIAITGIVY
ncbi:MAG: hypothetical protein H7A26_03210 [Spirochaetales bacterium]|nr:hypothetical protein [Spirochaetales bacterium]